MKITCCSQQKKREKKTRPDTQMTITASQISVIIRMTKSLNKNINIIAMKLN